MQTWDAIRSRRNVRTYADQPIPAEQLDQVLDAARRAPSAGNWQPWDFVVVTDRDQLTSLAQVWRGAAHVAHSAATVAFVVPHPKDEREQRLLYFDLGQAVMCLMIAAADLGIGSSHANVADQDLARSLLGFPEDRFCAHLVDLGQPADRPLAPIQRPDRRPFAEVVHRGHW